MRIRILLILLFFSSCIQADKNNQSCISAADYGSIYCMSHRKFKMPNNEIDSIVEDLNENKITPNQAREKLCLPKIKSAIEKWRNIVILYRFRMFRFHRIL